MDIYGKYGVGDFISFEYNGIVRYGYAERVEMTYVVVRVVAEVHPSGERTYNAGYKSFSHSKMGSGIVGHSEGVPA